jgi:hypothetical protein
MSTAFSDACFHCSSHVWCNPVKSSCVTETVRQTRHCQFVWHRKIGKCVPKLILTSYVRTRCQVVFDNEHSLYLWKRHPCTLTVWRRLTDWREQVTTWRGLRGFLYSHSYIVCLLIQTNCIELQQSICILIWVAWLFDHSVFELHVQIGCPGPIWKFFPHNVSSGWGTEVLGFKRPVLSFNG